MLLVLITFKNVQEDLSILLVGLHLDFLHSQELNNDVNLFILLQATNHRLNSEDLLCLLANGEIVLNGVLTLILQEQG